MARVRKETIPASLLENADSMTEMVFKGEARDFSNALVASLHDCESTRSMVSGWCGKKLACGAYGCAFESVLVSSQGSPLVIKVTEDNGDGTKTSDMMVGKSQFQESAAGLMWDAVIDAELVPPVAARTYAVLACQGLDVPLNGCAMSSDPKDPRRTSAWAIRRNVRAWNAIYDTVRGPPAASTPVDVPSYGRLDLHGLPNDKHGIVAADSILTNENLTIATKDSFFRLPRSKGYLWLVVKKYIGMPEGMTERTAERIYQAFRSTETPVVYTLMEAGQGSSGHIRGPNAQLAFFGLLAGGLCSAYRAFRFTHSDLHVGNVLFRNGVGLWRGKNSFTCKYALVRFARTLMVIPIFGKFPFVIDYGFSTFVPPCDQENTLWVDNDTWDRMSRGKYGSIFPGSTALDLLMFYASVRATGVWGSEDVLDNFYYAMPWGGIRDSDRRFDWKLMHDSGMPSKKTGPPDSAQFDHALVTLLKGLPGAFVVPEGKQLQYSARADVIDWT